ncbi:MAG TPA: topoisomerase C-terminal repeat-containing protein [Casimicrobiaceae bacterium]
MKHGGINATLPDKDRVDAVTLGEAVALLAAKFGKTRSARTDQVRQAGCEIGAPQARRLASREPRCCAPGRHAQEEGYSALYRVRITAELDALSERELAAPVDRAGLAAHVGLPRV